VRREQGEALEFTAYLAEHPGQAEVLRRLHAPRSPPSRTPSTFASKVVPLAE